MQINTTLSASCEQPDSNPRSAKRGFRNSLGLASTENRVTCQPMYIHLGQTRLFHPLELGQQ